jgi:hypothetical protein
MNLSEETKNKECNGFVLFYKTSCLNQRSFQRFPVVLTAMQNFHLKRYEKTTESGEIAHAHGLVEST